MALSSSEEEEHKSKPFSQNKRKRRRRCSPDQEENTVQFSLTGSIDQSEDEDEDGVGVVELRPPGVTNWKDQVSTFLVVNVGVKKPLEGDAVATEPSKQINKLHSSDGIMLPQAVSTAGHTLSQLSQQQLGFLSPFD